MSKSKKLSPVHPGEILREDFMKPLGLSMNKLALELRVPTTRIAEITNQNRGVTTETAMRLGRYFHTTAQFWLNLQRDYELAIAEDKWLAKIEKEVEPCYRLAH